MAHWQIKKGGQTAADQLEHMDVNKVLAQVHLSWRVLLTHMLHCTELIVKNCAAVCHLQQHSVFA